MAAITNQREASLRDRRYGVSGNAAGLVVGTLYFVITLAVVRTQNETADSVLMGIMALLYVALIIYVVRVKNGLPGLLVPVAGYVLAAFASIGMFRDPVVASEAGAIGTLRNLIDAEKEFMASKRLDSNKDGIGDYGSLEELKAAGFLAPTFPGDNAPGYIFDLTAIPGTGDTPEPRFQLRAVPMSQETKGAKGFYADESGAIRYSQNLEELGPTAPALGE